MEAVSEPATVEEATDEEFRSRVLGPHPRHHLAASYLAENVHASQNTPATEKTREPSRAEWVIYALSERH